MTDPSDPLAELEARYREGVRTAFEHLTLRGLSPTDAVVRLPLEQLYVDLRLKAEVPDATDEVSAAERWPPREPRRPGARNGPKEREPDSLRRQVLRPFGAEVPRLPEPELTLRGSEGEPPALVVLGEPGSGKSTLLHSLALRALRPGPTARLPVFVPLAAYDDALRGTNEPLSLERFLPLYYARWRGLPGLEPLFQRALKEGRALVLLDGLDEALTLETRRFVARQVEELLRAWVPLGNRFVLTSRLIGYREVRLPDDVPHFRVMDFSPREREHFIDQWCEAQAAGASAPRDAQRLREDLRNHPSVERLASNPLRLTLLALLRRDAGPLPVSRIELHERYVRALLSHWEHGRSEGARRLAAERLEPEGVEHHLMALALWMQRHRPSGTASRADLRRALAEQILRREGQTPRSASAERWAEAEQRAERVLHEVQDIAGLLGERGRDAYGFLHLSFQEYFVGRALARESAAGRWEMLRPHLHDPRWQEPLSLCAAWLGLVEHREEALTELVRGILHAHSEHEDVLHRDLFLAATMAAEDVTRCGRILGELVPRLAALRDSPVPSLRTHAMRLMGHLMCLGHEPAQACFITWLEEHTRRKETLQALEDVISASAPAGLRETLLVQLDDKKSNEHFALIRMLAFLVDGDERVRDALLALMPDPNVSQAAIEALAPWVDRDARVRQAFLSRFVQFGPARAGPGFLLGSDPITVALGAVLGRHAEVREAFLTQFAREPPRLDVVEHLGNAAAWDGEVREALLARLAHGSAETRQHIVYASAALASREPQVRDALLARLDDENPHVLQAVLHALGAGAVREARVRDALLARIDDKGPRFRSMVIDALGPEALREARVRDVILARLDDEQVRLSVLNALGAEMAGEARLGDALLAQLDADARVRQLPYDQRRLTRRQLPRFQVMAAMASRDERVRQALVRWLAVPWQPDRGRFLGALRGAGRIPEEIRDVLLLLLDKEPYLLERSDVLRTLGPLVGHDEKVRHALEAQLERAGPPLRWKSIALLGPWAGEDAQVRELLLALLEDKTDSARDAATQELAACVKDHAPVRDALLEKLRSEEHEGVQQDLIRSLAPAALGDRAVRYALLALRRARSSKVSRTAAEALRNVLEHDARVRQTFVEDLHHKKTRRTAAAVIALSGLAEHDEEIRQALVARLADPRFSELEEVTEGTHHRPVFRVEARGVLLGMASPLVLGPLARGHDGTRQALLAQLEDPREDVRTRAVQALSCTVGRSAEVRDALLARLDDEQPTVRREAAEALRPLVGDDAGVRHALLARFRSTERHASFVSALGPAASLDSEVRATLLAALDDQDRDVRLSAVGALGACVDAHPEVRQGLLARMDDVDWAMRATVVKTLVEHAPALLDTERVLLPWLGAMSGLSEDRWSGGCVGVPVSCFEIRQAIARRVAQLARQDDALMNRLVEMLRHPAWVIREGAAMALQSMPGGLPPRVGSLLKEVAANLRDEDDWEAKLDVIEVLLNSRDRSASQLAMHRAMLALDHGTRPWHDGLAMGRVRERAAQLLGRMEATHRDEPLLQRLIRLLREDAHEETREAAYQAVLRHIPLPPMPRDSEALPLP